jgi:TolB protein
MKKRSRSHLISKTFNRVKVPHWLLIVFFLLFFFPSQGFSKIYINVDEPYLQKLKIAIPDFKSLSADEELPHLSQTLPEIISNDLDISGYFTPMDKEAFLDEDGPLLTEDDVRFKNWSVIGAELLLKGGYISIGRTIEVEVRLYDVVWGRQLLAKRLLGKVPEIRTLMHRIGNEIISVLTGNNGVFLTKIAYVGTATGNKEIYVSDYDGHNAQPITTDQSIALLPRWSPQGDKIVYNSYKQGGANLYLKDLTTTEDRLISSRAGLNVGACWIPNQDKLALTLSIKGNPDIFVIDLSGQIIDRMTNNWGIDISPTFSPDGNKMAFVSDRSGSPQIYIKDLTTKQEIRLTYAGGYDILFESRYNSSPSWSKLNQIAFSGSNDGIIFDIYTIHPDGTHLRRLTEGHGKNEDPCWSPDGRYIVFSSNRGGYYHLYIMNANGQNQRRITFQNGEQTAPSWSPF